VAPPDERDLTVADQPYKHLPSRSFWGRSVARRFDPAEIATIDGPLLRAGEAVASMGSCFASNIVPHIEAAGIHYVRTEPPPPQVAHLPENLGYRNFSAAYGNVYTVRQMLQLVQRSMGAFAPAEDRWHENGVVIDPFRPGLAYPAVSDVEFDTITQSHLAATRTAFQQADVVVLTLGLTEAWESGEDGAVFPTCPGTVAGTFDPGRHRFHNFTVAEIVADLHQVLALVRTLRPGVRFILTVSPVPLVATASSRHVLEATVYSKSVLRVAAGEVERAESDATYFPAYEIVTGPQAPENFFEADRRSVSAEAIQTVMGALLSACEIAPAGDPTPATETPRAADRLVDISRRIANAECDEALLDEGLD
jgi:GSCFA family